MKKRFRKNKRDTLPVLLVKYIGSALLLAAAFAVGFQMYLSEVIHTQCNQQIDTEESETQNKINKLAAEYEGTDLMREISGNMALYTYYDIMIEDPFGRTDKMIQMVPKFSPKCHSAKALIDENGDVVASNKLTWMMHLLIRKGEKIPENGWYYCDRDAISIPEVQQLYEDYLALSQQEDYERYLDISIESAYVNTADHTFIPHKGTMTLTQVERTPETLFEVSKTDENLIDSKDIDITIDIENYELMTMHSVGSQNDYPQMMLPFPQGETPENLAAFEKEFVYGDDTNYSRAGYQMHKDGTETYTRSCPIYINKQKYFLTHCLTVNMKDPLLVAFYWRWTVAFAVGIFLLALALCWRRHTVNKTKYAFEDYQRDLTNHLAHDIKTPLTAIGGYTENLMEGQLTADEQQQYLQGILDNVSFTDSLISRTLNLNNMDSSKKPEREKLSAGSIAETVLTKYAPLLEEKEIRYSVNGTAEIKAERASFVSILENLIGNAVKYTPQEGEIKVTISKKRIVITNTVTEKIHTTDLKRPFVRGDKARSNSGGVGLGLSIAERAALLNGFTLKLSCNDTEFKAEVKL